MESIVLAAEVGKKLDCLSDALLQAHQRIDVFLNCYFHACSDDYGTLKSRSPCRVSGSNHPLQLWAPTCPARGLTNIGPTAADGMALLGWAHVMETRFANCARLWARPPR